MEFQLQHQSFQPSGLIFRMDWSHLLLTLLCLNPELPTHFSSSVLGILGLSRGGAGGWGLQANGEIDGFGGRGKGGSLGDRDGGSSEGKVRLRV